METNIVKKYRDWLESNRRFAQERKTHWWQWRVRAEQAGRVAAYAYALYEFNKLFADWDGSGVSLIEKHGKMEAVIEAARQLVAPNIYGSREYLIDRLAALDAGGDA